MIEPRRITNFKRSPAELEELLLFSAFLDRRWPGLRAAHRLSADDAPLRWEVCARLLAGQNDDEIAARYGLSPDTVRWFEALFFRVRDRLHATDWIASQVIGPGTWRGFAREELGKVWMLFGFSAGPSVLDVVLAVTQDRPLPEWVRAPAGERQRLYEARIRLSCRLAVAVRMLRSAADVPAVRQLARARRRLERAAQGLPDAPDRTLEAQLDLLAGFVSKKRAVKGQRKEWQQKRPVTATASSQSVRRQRRTEAQSIE